MTILKKMALAAGIAAFFVTGAQAATTDYGLFLLQNSTENTPGVSTGSYTVDNNNVAGDEVSILQPTRAKGDRFVDDYLLEINDGQDVSFYVSTPVGFVNHKVTGQVTFSGFMLTDLTGQQVFEPLDFDFSSFALAADWTLQSGTYDLEIWGTVNVADGNYAGAIATTPAVPEPSNIALLLAGIGAVGALARRRKVSAQA